MKNKITKAFIIFILLFIPFLPLLITSCEDNPLDFNAFTPADDVKLGDTLNLQIRKDQTNYPLYNSPTAIAYLQEIIDKITESSLIKYNSLFKYRDKIGIIRDNNTVNAFALPGGPIYVYTGLLKFVDDEATLAAVIAHEIAHAERRHATKRITKAYGINFILGLLLGSNPSEFEKIASNLFAGLYLLQNSRDDEYEADEYSFNYLYTTNKYYAGAIKFFFDKIKSNEGSNFLEVLLSTHPLPQDRINKINDLINQKKLPEPNESNLFRTRYTQFKNTLP